MPTIEELRRVEELLEKVLQKLESLEELLSKLVNDPTYAVALELTTALSLPAYEAIRVAERIVSILRGGRGADPIERTILEVLVAQGDGVSISELTRRVRALRGTASRRIISARLRSMESRGLVELRRVGNAVRVYLKKDS